MFFVTETNSLDISTIESSVIEYIKSSESEKRKQIMDILGEKKKEFSIAMSNSIPVLSHKQYNLQFVYVPGGEYLKGFTRENQHAAEKISKVVNANYNEMRPVKLKKVAPFLITRTPVLNC